MNSTDAEIIVDLREPYVYGCGSIPGAINIPINRLSQLYDLPRDKKICVLCQKGEVSAEITKLLIDAGYDAYNYEGGYLAYLKKYIEENKEQEDA